MVAPNFHIQCLYSLLFCNRMISSVKAFFHSLHSPLHIMILLKFNKKSIVRTLCSFFSLYIQLKLKTRGLTKWALILNSSFIPRMLWSYWNFVFSRWHRVVTDFSYSVGGLHLSLFSLFGYALSVLNSIFCVNSQIQFVEGNDWLPCSYDLIFCLFKCHWLS